MVLAHEHITIIQRAIAKNSCPNALKQWVDIMKPIRIQRKRTKGWKMPPNTVYVGRPTKWGNPFKGVDAKDSFEQMYKQAIEDYADKIQKYPELSFTDYCHGFKRQLSL